ncbi:hypothetical protein CSO01_16600 [Cellulomonas soli]|uniref:Cysteine-rich CPCC domain-containing protein n=1 Tax=Cellulomonas soli TaxID=931535 RepID=A0A512PCK9_9CELL|nr:hypothetical protein CSO01_16600 [Cellulomonas soli]
MNLQLCRVCGWDLGENGWEGPGATPNYVICDCCGNESGVDDLDRKMIGARRAAWISKGFLWMNEESRPSNWVPEHQLNTVALLWP